MMDSGFEGDAGKAQRVGLFGGTFDPVHCAHLQIARRVREALSLDQVIFIPNAQSPIKEFVPGASGSQRRAMLALAIEGEAGFSVDPYELERGGLSYSIETALYFGERFPGAELFWIMGADQFEQLGRWREIERLASLLTFAVFRRAEASVVAPKVVGLRYTEVDAPLMDISSSAIRAAFAKGEIPKGHLPRGLDAFILREGLYKR